VQLGSDLSAGEEETKVKKLSIGSQFPGLAVAGTFFASLCLAQTQSGPAARILETQQISGTDREMVMREVTIPPGGAAPLHRHTVAGLVFIVEGVAESAYGNDSPKLYHTGETLQDVADVPHTLFRNADPNKPLRFLTFYAAAKGQPYVVTP
jgi:quercetin dioxygenase-like cupin family protein